MSEVLINNHLEFRMDHFFSQDVYVRQIIMPAGCFVQGKRHKTRHLNTVISGRVMLYDNDTHHIKVIEGPCTFESMPGVAKTLYIHSETIWQTIHSNPENDEDTVLLEKRCVHPDLDNAQEMILEFQKVLGGDELCLG